MADRNAVGSDEIASDLATLYFLNHSGQRRTQLF